MLLDYFRLATGSLKKRRTRTLLTMIGIFIGIASVVALIGLGEGLRVAITGQFGFLGSDVLSVQAAGLGFAGPPGQGVVDPLSEDLVEKISKVSGVEASIARYIESGTLEFNDQQAIGIAATIPTGENRKIFEKMINLKVESGRLLKDKDSKKVLLGNNFKNDDIVGKGIVVGNRILINDITFEVVGIIEKKGSFIFDNGVFVNEQAAFDFLDVDKDKVDVIAVKVKDVNRIDETKLSIDKLLRKERGVDEGEENFAVQSPQATLAALDNTLFAVQLFVTIIALISLLVGGIGIMNTMYTSVLERTKEIGIMKSIGARNSAVFAIFAMESGVLGLIGGVIGVSLGFLIANGLAILGRSSLGSELIQASISLGLVFGALAFSFIIGTLFGVLPALQASKLNPVDSLRSAK